MNGQKTEMVEKELFEIHPDYLKRAIYKSREEYEALYRASINDPDKFWAEKAEQMVDWYEKWHKVSDNNFKEGIIKYFLGGKLNVSYNCLDRHLKTWRKNKAALIFEGEPGDSRIFTYQQLYHEVNKFANVLKKKGIRKGDRVAIYLPMIPELPIAMLACARIGAIHSIVFGGFSAESLRSRIQDCGAKLLVTSDGAHRSGKVVSTKRNADEALEECPTVEKVIVVKRTGWDVPMDPNRDSWFGEEMAAQDIAPYCEPEWMDAEDPLFILYTSGSTGKPKGVVHTTGGYLVFVAYTFQIVFNYHEEDTFWCTADIGWVTGHSYIVYGPLCSGATSLMFEGVPSYPGYDRFWDVVEKYKVDTIYTAPTAIRAIKKEGDEWVAMHDISSLKLLGTVGEPINPEAWLWYHYIIGREKCPIVDTWWQTETGGILISPVPGSIPLKPGSATLPLPGIKPAVVNERGQVVEGEGDGYLCIEMPWPGIARGVYGDPARFKTTYFEQVPGYYFTGDGCRRDKDGYYWVTGRVDDVINVSGHRLGTAEVESALVAHSAVAEAAVVGYPHPVKGDGIFAFVTLNPGQVKSDELKKVLVNHVRKLIGPIAAPDKIQFADGLPKTRSGKIMRRILKKIAREDVSDLGDTSTLLDPGVVDALVRERPHV
jgi:acetyl-CoA synthetase